MGTMGRRSRDRGLLGRAAAADGGVRSAEHVGTSCPERGVAAGAGASIDAKASLRHEVARGE